MSERLENYITTILPKMEGWCSPEKARAMAENISEHKPHVFLEIGVFAGRSLIASALAMQDNGFGVAWGIDPWKAGESVLGFNDENAKWWSALNHEVIYQKCVRHIAELGVAPIINLMRMTSAEALLVPTQHTIAKM